MIKDHLGGDPKSMSENTDAIFTSVCMSVEFIQTQAMYLYSMNSFQF